MFKWDGSNISDFLNRKDVFWEEAIYKKYIIWRIYYGDQTELCYIRASNSYLPCLIDEFKPIFGLEKIGTRWCKYKGRYLILLKPNVQNDTIIKEISLYDVYIEDEYFREMVRRIFLFREMLGITRSNEKSIICRDTPLMIKPISFYDPNMIPIKNGKVLSNNILNSWFDGSLDESIKDFLHIENRNDITGLIFKLRTKMEEIVNRIDKKYIPYIDQIVSRIQSRLQHILNKL